MWLILLKSVRNKLSAIRLIVKKQTISTITEHISKYRHICFIPECVTMKIKSAI